MKTLLLVFAFVPSLIFSQSRKQKKAIQAQLKTDQLVAGNFKNHVQYLLNQNEKGSANPQQSEEITNYISNQFTVAGLKPKGDHGFVQQFKVDDGKQIDGGTYLKVNGNNLVLHKEYVPLAYSAIKKVTGMPAMALREKGVPWFADVKDWAEENAPNTLSGLHPTIQKEALKAAAKGAAALFLYNSSNQADSLDFNRKDKTAPLPIPVVYILPGGYKKYFHDHEQILDIELNVAFKETERIGKSIVGYIDKGAPSSVIIGAAYKRSMVPADNALVPENVGKTNSLNYATSTAMLIELAKMLSASPANNNNYLFVAFDEEGTGAGDSNPWLKNASISSPNYIVHLDNVNIVEGNKNLYVGGYVNSTALKETIKGLTATDLTVNVDTAAPASAGFHSFYQKNIPVLNVYTAAKNTTGGIVTAEQINYLAEVQIARFLTRLVEATEKKGKLAMVNKEAF